MDGRFDDTSSYHTQGEATELDVSHIYQIHNPKIRQKNRVILSFPFLYLCKIYGQSEASPSLHPFMYVQMFAIHNSQCNTRYYHLSLLR